ncbi:putative metabolite transport protein [Alternaria tenuissima]|jgi:MFS family permease|uniref:Metabolite transport protein n=2 Tax=Alternaria alternata complex TaxID=187734 RepID=A0AB37WGD3_9PLEO|nr:putative metabolite transport protein [Alternaria tenuissima]RYN77089.1 putative metabolite transport protein [Alternaria alternata]RYO00783.1 putative metabolite transport protein [Alternaria tenuissima]RYO14626.1 putative metabolite transport protein [Alternaria tenuissima]
MASAAEVQPGLYNATDEKGDIERRGSVARTEKGRWERLWPVIACGAGLFSDGYLNNIIGPVNTMLKTIYPDSYANSSAQANVASITFAGTVVGMLFFGYTSDHFSRKWSLFTSTIIIILFAILGTASYGAGGSPSGLLTALVVYRFFLGIGIGGEYPAGSVGCAESTGELKQGTRNKWFILFTNVQIDLAFFISAIVATVVVLATGENHLRAAWRICLGIGVIPPLSLLYLRLKLQEPEAFKRESLAKAKTPWLLIIKYYWFRLSIVSIIWFIYDFSAYSFGIYATSILANLLGESAPLWKSLAWNILINFFYMPGCLAGAFVADLPSMGPKKTLFIGVTLQGIIGFIMAGCYPWLNKPENVAGFVVVYGIFLALGEFGPGDNIGLVASKTCATGIRGQYYGIAAAVGKIGAFAGSYALDALQKAAGDDEIAAGRNPFFVASTLAFVAAGLVLLLPHIGQDTIDQEDVKFREYLTANGYDTSKMGLQSGDATGVESDENGVVPVEQTYVK